TGRYVLPPEIFGCLERTKPGAGNEIQLTDGMRILAREVGLLAHIYDGVSYDAGDKLGFLKATVEIALQNPELGKPFREYLKNLKLYLPLSLSIPVCWCQAHPLSERPPRERLADSPPLAAPQRWPRSATGSPPRFLSVRRALACPARSLRSKY